MLSHDDVRYLKKHYRYVVGRGQRAYCILCNVEITGRDRLCQSRRHRTMEPYLAHVAYLVSKGLQPQLSNSLKSLTIHMPSGWRYIRLAELDIQRPQQVYTDLITGGK